MDDGAKVLVCGVDEVVARFVEGFDAGEAEFGDEGLVKEFNAGDDVAGAGVARGDKVEGVQGLGDCGAFLPVDGARTAGIIETLGWWLELVGCT